MANFVAIFMAIGLLFFGQASADAAKILYIPIDNRPVCLEDPLQTMQAAGVDAVAPPETLLAGRDRAGDPEQLWDWLNSQAHDADAVVLSADSLLYGGLVPSRTHHLPQTQLEERLAKFRDLREKYPDLPIYVFSTIMRTPKMSAGGVDPAYFEQYGEQIFHYSALQDKSEQEPLSQKEQLAMANAFAAIPEPAMVDWLSRRQINYNINAQLLALTREGIFSFFVLGRDDNDRYSRTRQELRNLLAAEPELHDGADFATFPGADQLGLILLTRAVNVEKGYRPFVAALYAPGTGPQTIPTYQGETVFNSVLNHVIAAGGYLIFSPDRADMVLAVNTAASGVTLEAAHPANTRLNREDTAQFVEQLAGQLKERPVAVADIAYGNGADNSLMAQMADRDIPRRLAAYSGWNTASNSVGFAISQGVLSKWMSEPDRQKLLSVRLLDDWAYQANVRQSVKRELVYPKGINEVQLGSGRALVEAETTARLKRFAAENFGQFPVPDFSARHPWNRMFEVEIVQPGLEYKQQEIAASGAK